MKAKRFTEEQIIGVLKEGKRHLTAAYLSRKRVLQDSRPIA